MTGNENERVVIKLGGGLITEKSKLCTPRKEVIKEIALAINELRSNGISMILVHGAGSFGHLKAKSWSLEKGTNESISGAANGRGPASLSFCLSVCHSSCLSVALSVFLTS